MVAAMSSQEGRTKRVPAPKTHKRVPSLRHYRVHHYWSQRELAQAAHVSIGTVAAAEQNHAISLVSRQKIADALGVSVRDLEAEEPQP
jgi:transcriptional regulator with XRE-family HTH domain